MSASRPSIAVRLLVPIVALVASLGVLVGGALWSASASDTLSAALTSQTGTAADVYGSQSAIVISSALLSAGIIGTVVSLAALGILIALGALSKSADDELDLLVEDDDYETADEAVPAGAVPAGAAPAAAAAAPVAATPVVPTAAGVPADEPIIATSATDEPDVTAVPTEAATPAGSFDGSPEASATEALAEPAPEPEGDRRA
jgi:hypothetical protein